MRFRTRALVLFCLAALPGLSALAQPWGAGAAFGTVTDVSRRFSLEDFHYTDWNGWVQFEVESRVQLRGTYGSLKTRSANSERVVTDSSGTNFNASVLSSEVHYGTIGASYEFWEGDYTSGIFAGVGAYHNRPEPSSEGFQQFNDPRRTVFGWHAGVDASLRVVSRLSVVGRVTFHRFRLGTGRSILTADGGLQYRF